MIESPQFKIHTFGCKVNHYDTGLLENRLRKQGWDHQSQDLSEGQPQRVHILNTCAVTAEATKEAVRTIRRIKAKDPLAVTLVTGCAAQVDTGVFEALTQADLIVANSHKGQLEQIVEQYFKGGREQRTFKSNIFKKEDLEPGGGRLESRTRSFLKIQDGCDSFCTFCVIPFARGKSRSLSIIDLVDRVRELTEQGIKEIILTGVHIGDYFDQGLGLSHLVQSVLLNTNVSRLRLSSLEPIELTDHLMELYQDPRMCKHFHISLQSVHTRVLKAMKRKYGFKEVQKALCWIERALPNAFTGMDVIAGFPGESEREFQVSLQRLMDLPWTRIHAFPYSPRPGTYAARQVNEQLNRGLIKQRAQQLRELSRIRFEQRALAQRGTTKQVLILKDGLEGLSRDFWKIKFAKPLEGFEGQEVELRISGVEPDAGGKGDWVLLAVP